MLLILSERSDDGQRSMRYTPFYANSGFYYLLSTERSVYFTWSIMTAMDSIQVGIFIGIMLCCLSDT